MHALHANCNTTVSSLFELSEHNIVVYLCLQNMQISPRMLTLFSVC